MHSKTRQAWLTREARHTGNLALGIRQTSQPKNSALCKFCTRQTRHSKTRKLVNPGSENLTRKIRHSQIRNTQNSPLNNSALGKLVSANLAKLAPSKLDARQIRHSENSALGKLSTRQTRKRLTQQSALGKFGIRYTPPCINALSRQAYSPYKMS